MGSDLTKQPESQGLNLTDIMTAINLGGKTFAGTGGSKTETKGQKFSQEQMNSMLQSILEQTGGYADIGQQVHAAGGYNSSTQGLMLNDLLTRSAQRVAELNTEQTVTQTEQTDPLIGTEGLAGMAGALGLGQLLSSGASALGMGTAIKSGVSAAGKALGFGDAASAGQGAWDLSAANAAKMGYDPAFASSGTSAVSESLGTVDAASTVAADTGGFWSGVGDFSLGRSGSTAGTIGQGVGYAKAAYDAYNDIKDDNWGGAVGAGVGAWFGGPAGEMAGQFIGTAADKYILDPLNDSVIKPVGHAFDEAITQNVGSAVKSVGKAVGKVGKSVGHALSKLCFLGGTRILMADGLTKEISTLALGDNVAIGGRVTAIGSALATDIYNYKGELCTGSHVVLEDGEWIAVKESTLSTGPHGSQEYVVHPVTTENHVLVTTSGFISSDYAGVDGDYSEVEKLDILNADADRTAELAAELDDLFAETVQE